MLKCFTNTNSLVEKGNACLFVCYIDLVLLLPQMPLLGRSKRIGQNDRDTPGARMLPLSMSLCDTSKHLRHCAHAPRH
jgi:hypothetical protein